MKSYVALFIALSLLVCSLFIIAAAPFAYPLDDAYIHMALGRTLATTHLWGVVPGEPAAASSSPLWTLILAAFYAVVPNDGAFLYVPLLLNLAASGLLIFVLANTFAARPLAPVLVASILFAGSVASLAMLGMEHVLHAALAVALCLAACAEMERDRPKLFLVAALSAAAVATRYESAFLVAALVGLAAFRLRITLALALGIGGLFPIAAFGLLWLHDGGWFLPNSLILKRSLAEHSGLSSFVGAMRMSIRSNLREASGFYALYAAGAILMGAAVLKGSVSRKPIALETAFGFAATGATILHLALAKVGWLYRYEAWLLVLDTTAVALLASRLFGRRGVIIVSALIVGVFAARTARATKITIEAIDDRRLEHVAPAAFVARDYEGQTVMVNDLGAIAWFAPQTKPLDVYGLGSNEPIREILSPQGYGAASVEAWARRSGARIAVLQLCWPAIRPLIPDGWTLVASWHIPRNVVFRDRFVGFFSTTQEAARSLREQLQAFQIPERVTLNFAPDVEEILRTCYDPPLVPRVVNNEP